MIIYKATNLVNGKIYVGKTDQLLSNRKMQHYICAFKKNHKSIFCIAIRKYGWENFSWEIIDQGLSIELEKYWIKKLNCKMPNGYNMSDGGNGALGRKLSEKSAATLIECNKNRIWSDEAKRKISIAHKGNQVWLGRKHSDETKKKISIYRQGKMLSPEIKKKISVSLKGNQHLLGFKFSLESKIKMRESAIRRRNSWQCHGQMEDVLRRSA